MKRFIFLCMALICLVAIKAVESEKRTNHSCVCMVQSHSPDLVQVFIFSAKTPETPEIVQSEFVFMKTEKNQKTFCGFAKPFKYPDYGLCKFRNMKYNYNKPGNTTTRHV